MLTVEGLTISERSVGEHDKFISVLTSECGTIDIYVRGGNKITGKNQSAAQLFVYAKFCVNIKKDKYYLNSSEVIRDFYNIRLDIKKLALACYMGEAAKFAVMTKAPKNENEAMRLILNCLYMLSEDKRDCRFIKSVFELRFISEIGMMPQLIGCRVCYSYDEKEMYFQIDECCILCGKHFEEAGLAENSRNIRITPSQLSALQFICLSDMEKIFNFRISDESAEVIAQIAEKYMVARLGRSFSSLEYYHAV